MRKSLVLFSGGLDSFLSLLIAIKDGGTVTPIFYNYGQNPYEQEKKAVCKICKKLGLTPIEINLTGIGHLLSSSYTTGKEASENKEYTSYVPNRNLLFLTLASNLAHLQGYKYIYTGFYFKSGKSEEYLKGGKLTNLVDNHLERMDKEDYEYTPHPDQSREFIDLVGQVLKISDTTNAPEVVNPLAELDKVDIYSELEKMGQMAMAVVDTYSCYSNSDTKHYWGRGCGNCTSCTGRKKAYDVLKINYGEKTNRS